VSIAGLMSERHANEMPSGPAGGRRRAALREPTPRGNDAEANPTHWRGAAPFDRKGNAMDLMNLLIVIVGLGTAAFIAVVLFYAAGSGAFRAWHRLSHRDGPHSAR
jgi:hypothetical protein